MIHHTRIDQNSHKPKKQNKKTYAALTGPRRRAGPPCAWPRAAGAACWASPAPRPRQHRSLLAAWLAGRVASVPCGRALPAARRPASAPTSVAAPPGRALRRRRLAGPRPPPPAPGAARRPRLRLRGRKDRIEEGGEEEESSRERDAREKKSRRDKRGDRVK